MKREYARQEAERLLPLLRSIGREARARLAELRHIQERLAALSPTRHVHGGDVLRLQSELSTQRRELRGAERELARLGCRLETDPAVRILVPAERSAHVVEGFLGQTRFQPAQSDHRAVSRQGI